MAFYFRLPDFDTRLALSSEIYVSLVLGDGFCCCALNDLGEVLSFYSWGLSRPFARTGVSLFASWLSGFVGTGLPVVCVVQASDPTKYKRQVKLVRSFHELVMGFVSSLPDTFSSFFFTYACYGISPKFLWTDDTIARDADGNIDEFSSYYKCALSLFSPSFSDFFSGKVCLDLRNPEPSGCVPVCVLLMALCLARLSYGDELPVMEEPLPEPPDLPPVVHPSYPYEGLDLAAVSRCEWRLFKESGYTRHPLPGEVRAEVESESWNL